MRNTFMTGGMLAALTVSYVNAINSDAMATLSMLWKVYFRTYATKFCYLEVLFTAVQSIGLLPSVVL